MEPIINPMFFYWLDVIPNIAIGIRGAGFVTLGLLFCFSPFFFMEEFADFCKNPVRLFFNILIGCVLITFLGFLIPSKTAMIQIAIASKATPENIESIIRIGKNLKDEAKQDVIDVIESIKSE